MVGLLAEGAVKLLNAELVCCHWASVDIGQSPLNDYVVRVHRSYRGVGLAWLESSFQGHWLRVRRKTKLIASLNEENVGGACSKTRCCEFSSHDVALQHLNRGPRSVVVGNLIVNHFRAAILAPGRPSQRE